MITREQVIRQCENDLIVARERTDQLLAKRAEVQDEILKLIDEELAQLSSLKGQLLRTIELWKTMPYEDKYGRYWLLDKPAFLRLKTTALFLLKQAQLLGKYARWAMKSPDNRGIGIVMWVQEDRHMMRTTRSLARFNRLVKRHPDCSSRWWEEERPALDPVIATWSPTSNETLAHAKIHDRTIRIPGRSIVKSYLLAKKSYALEEIQSMDVWLRRIDSELVNFVNNHK